jgi:hypothetical protein
MRTNEPRCATLGQTRNEIKGPRTEREMSAARDFSVVENIQGAWMYCKDIALYTYSTVKYSNFTKNGEVISSKHQLSNN